MIWLEKWKMLTPLQKLPKNVGDLGKLIVAKDFKKLPKVKTICSIRVHWWKARKREREVQTTFLKYSQNDYLLMTLIQSSESWCKKDFVLKK